MLVYEAHRGGGVGSLQYELIILDVIGTRLAFLGVYSKCEQYVLGSVNDRNLRLICGVWDCLWWDLGFCEI